MRGLRVPDGAPTEWWVQDGAIRSAPATGTGGPYVVEGGLVDAHVHLTFEPHDVFNLPRGSAELIRAGLGAHRRAGELIVRDAGSLPGNGPIDGVIGCGPFLAPPGHFSPHLYAGTEPGEPCQPRRGAIQPLAEGGTARPSGEERGDHGADRRDLLDLLGGRRCHPGGQIADRDLSCQHAVSLPRVSDAPVPHPVLPRCRRTDRSLTMDE